MRLSQLTHVCAEGFAANTESPAWTVTGATQNTDEIETDSICVTGLDLPPSKRSAEHFSRTAPLVHIVIISRL